MFIIVVWAYLWVFCHGGVVAVVVGEVIVMAQGTLNVTWAFFCFVECWCVPAMVDFERLNIKGKSCDNSGTSEVLSHQ